MKYIPNFITSLNLTSGFIAIIFAANGDLVTASWFILAAMIFDFLDGFSARLLKAYSAIGKELDSLADVVSFGVAPGLIIYQLLNDSLSLSAPIDDSDSVKTFLIMLIPVIMPVCGALRLAIFNLDTTQSSTFKGLPIPANALAVISVVIAAEYSHSTIFSSFTGSPLAMILLALISSGLMVTRIPLISMKVSNLKLKGNEGRLILAGLVLVSFAFLGFNAAPLIIPFYILSSMIALLF
jgi:CDP-diacylglycerol---serine O-phosphatidyltransferase